MFTRTKTRAIALCGQAVAAVAFAVTAAAYQDRPAVVDEPQRPTTVTVVDVPKLPPSSGIPPTVETMLAAKPASETAPLSQGVLVENVAGEVVREELADRLFNPASAVKLATAFAALRSLGPDHRFATAIWTNGSLDEASGTITGDLIVSGRDPSFHYEHAVLIARELNRRGIRTVTGDLVVAPRFTMNFSASSLRSGERFYDTLDATRRPAAATRAWYDSRITAGDSLSLQQAPPSVAVMGAVYVDSVPAGSRTLITHRSSALVDILKVLLCYSNNFMADRLGDTIGGPQGVRRFLISELGLPEAEVRLASTSGLGINRLTPRGMLKIYRGLLNELARHRLGASAILPVAGIDPGTLQKRYDSSPGRGSIIAKTGTLIRTDGGASALVGQFRTGNGETLLFALFDQRGSVLRFRDAQDRLIAEIQNARGGPAPFTYSPQTLAMRLSDTELDVPAPEKPEFEPESN